MSAAVFIRPSGQLRWCRLLTIGIASHVTACGARIDAVDPVLLTPTVPPPELFCSACRVDLEAKRARAVTIDLRPNARELGTAADIEVDTGTREIELDDEWGPDPVAVTAALVEHEDLLDCSAAEWSGE